MTSHHITSHRITPSKTRRDVVRSFLNVCTTAPLSSFPAQSNNISSVRKSTRLCKATTARQQQEHTSRYLTNINTTLSQSLVSVSITHHHHRQSLNSSILHIIHQVRYLPKPHVVSHRTSHHPIRVSNRQHVQQRRPTDRNLPLHLRRPQAVHHQQ